MDHIKQLLEELSFTELQKVLRIASDLAHAKNPETIEYNKKMIAIRAERDRNAAVENARNDAILEKLRLVLKPGMRLKMKGCKDGVGLREFIEFGKNNHLVCWQLLRRRTWNGKVAVYDVARSNQVTTHMPNKVSWVLIDNVQVPIKNLIA